MVVLWRWWVEIVGEGCWRVAEVSLTLDGVPVRIVILWDVQRRGAQLSWPLCRPSDATDRRAHARRATRDGECFKELSSCASVPSVSNSSARACSRHVIKPLVENRDR